MSFFDYPSRTHSRSPEADATFLEGATRAQWDAIVARVGIEVFTSGQTIIEAGQPGDAFFILIAGEVDAVARGMFGERVLARIRSGSVFGEISFLDGGVRTATIRAVEDGSLIRVTRESLTLLAAWEPALAARMTADLGRICALRLRRMIERSRQTR